MSNLRSLAKPDVLIPLITLATAVFSSRRAGSPKMVQLTDTEGERILVRPSRVFVIHAAPVRTGSQQGTQLQVLGLKDPLIVLETLSQVSTSLGGDWVMLHSPGSWLNLGPGKVEVLVDASQVISVEPSPYRMSRTNKRLTDVQLSEDYRLQVMESVSVVARLLGM